MAGTSSVDPVDMPAMTPPAGVQPNFVNPPSLEPLSIAVIVLCLSLTLIALCIKLFTKLWIKSLRIEDCMSFMPDQFETALTLLRACCWLLGA